MGDRNYQRDQDKLNRGDNILQEQRSGFLGRAGDLNELGQTQLRDESVNATAIRDMVDPYKYKQELQRDTNRAMQLKKAAAMLGMPTSALFNNLNSDESIVQRNANAVMGSEMNATDISPGRSSRNVGQLLGMNPLSSAVVGGQNSQLANYVGGKNAAYSGMRQGMMDNTNDAYDKYDDSVKRQMANGGDDIDPETGKKKTSGWRKVLGGVVKYGVPIALAATGVGAPAAAAMMAGSSFGGDMIAGKGVGESLMGAGMAAIPGGQMGSGMASGIANKVGRTAVEQGLRAAGENVPYVGAGLTLAGGLQQAGALPKAFGNSKPSPLAAAVNRQNPFQMPNALTQSQNLFPNRKNPFASVRF